MRPRCMARQNIATHSCLLCSSLLFPFSCLLASLLSSLFPLFSLLSPLSISPRSSPVIPLSQSPLSLPLASSLSSLSTLSPLSHLVVSLFPSLSPFLRLSPSFSLLSPLCFCRSPLCSPIHFLYSIRAPRPQCNIPALVCMCKCTHLCVSPRGLSSNTMALITSNCGGAPWAANGPNHLVLGRRLWVHDRLG